MKNSLEFLCERNDKLVDRLTMENSNEFSEEGIMHWLIERMSVLTMEQYLLLTSMAMPTIKTPFFREISRFKFEYFYNVYGVWQLSMAVVKERKMVNKRPDEKKWRIVYDRELPHSIKTLFSIVMRNSYFLLI